MNYNAMVSGRYESAANRSDVYIPGLQSLEDGIDAREPGESDRRSMLSNTLRIQNALNEASQSGGGTVIIPPGRYHIRTIDIPSFTNLQLANGCRLIAWPYIEDYEPSRGTGVDPSDCRRHLTGSGISLIVSFATESVSLTGRGIIDGNGFAFWDIPVREYVRRGGDSADLELSTHWEEDSPFWRAKQKRISPFVEFDGCRDVLIRDVTITDSPGWTIHTVCCDRVTVDNIHVKNHMYGPNTDGIDINGCRDVTVQGCAITCGDDAIIVKATEHARSCERICISDCVLETNCAAIGIGAEVAHTIRDIAATGIAVKRALRMIQIELWDPGLVENVIISNVVGATMSDIPLERPIYIDIQHHGRTDGVLGAVRNVQIHALAAVTRGRCLFTAADGASIEHLVLTGIQLTYPEIEDPESSVPSSRSNQMSNDNPHTRSRRSAFVFDNVRYAFLRDIDITWPSDTRDDRTSVLRGSYDWGELSSDRRKQQSLQKEPAMNGFVFRRCSNVAVDAPFLHGYRAPLSYSLEANERIIINRKDVCEIDS